MTIIFLKFLILCFSCYIIAAENPDANENGCSDIFKNFYISGLPEVENWKYEERNDGDVLCNGTLKYSKPQVLTLHCDRKTQDFSFFKFTCSQEREGQSYTNEARETIEEDHEYPLNLYTVINPRYDFTWIVCETKFPNNVSTYVTVDLQYEPDKALPVENRPNLANAVTFEIKTNDSGDVYAPNTNISITSEQVMFKVTGSYDQIDHFWCEIIVDKDYDRINRPFVDKADFAQYENPKEAIAIVINEFSDFPMQWNCTLLTRKGSDHIHQNNLYKYEDELYSKTQWTETIYWRSV